MFLRQSNSVKEISKGIKNVLVLTVTRNTHADNKHPKNTHIITLITTNYCSIYLNIKINLVT